MITASTYAEFRAAAWEQQGRDRLFDFYNSAPKNKDGVWEYPCYLQPKKVLFYKDVWHCMDMASTKELAINLLKFVDTYYIKVGRKYLHVDYQIEPGGTHLLPGQTTDKERHTG